ncbi:hypothetical protein LC609_20210 [Nostoc sp. XA013]|nr:hypothetical protein [Nostoc sp. XA013]
MCKGITMQKANLRNRLRKLKDVVNYNQLSEYVQNIHRTSSKIITKLMRA